MGSVPDVEEGEVALSVRSLFRSRVVVRQGTHSRGLTVTLRLTYRTRTGKGRRRG